MAGSRIARVSTIRATPEKVRQALTMPEVTRRY